ncbi:MAG: redoxin family protein [Myxococcota bacterium]|nr:redoxin family protein [Myxococcota bacterium]
MILPLLLACAANPLPPERRNPAPFGDAAPASAVLPGEPAPVFSAVDLDGTAIDLAALSGTVVVLEFFNPDCPFVAHAHDDGTLETAPATWARAGVRWVPVNANRPGSTGADPGLNRRKAAGWDLPSPVLDSTGAIARAYGATVTPTLAIVDTEGTLAYFGGPDNAPLGRPDGGPLIDHTAAVLGALTQRLPSPYARQKASGCTIKF